MVCVAQKALQVEVGVQALRQALQWHACAHSIHQPYVLSQVIEKPVWQTMVSQVHVQLGYQAPDVHICHVHEADQLSMQQ